LSGGGEPTVLKGWSAYADKLINNGVEVALISNGIAVQEKHLDTIRKMNYIAISIYSTHEKRYQQITESRFFKKQFSLAQQIKSKATNTVVGARCVLNDINFDEIDLIYKQAIDSGFDYVIFIPAVDYEGKGVVLSSQAINSIKSIIHKQFNLFDSNKTNIQKLLNLNVSHYDKGDYRSSLPDKVQGCQAINIRNGLFVNYDGGIYLCQPDIGNKSLEIGNINHNSFMDIWNSTQHQNIIVQLHKRYNQGQCKNCRSIAFNQSIYEEIAGYSSTLPGTKDPFL